MLQWKLAEIKLSDNVFHFNNENVLVTLITLVLCQIILGNLIVMLREALIRFNTIHQNHMNE